MAKIAIKQRTGFLLAFLVCALAPFVTARGQSPDGGVLISRVSSEAWQIRLIAGTEARRFNGVVESTASFSSVTAVYLETTDEARLSSPNVLSADFSVWPGRTDGVNFSVAADAQLCLRDTGSTGVQFYLGNSLADAVPVSAPVALTSADSCGGTAPPPPPPSPRKYHPGHYIGVLRNTWQAQSVMAASVKPGVVGFMKRYTWRSLEPTPGVYQFTELQSDLDWAVAYGMQLIVMIEDKTFLDERPTPAYLDPYTPRNNLGGYTALRWSPYVLTREKALIKALGERFDSHPAFEGIATQETAPSLDGPTLDANGYTPEKYRDAYIDLLTDATQSLPTSRVFWFMNFLPRHQSYIASIASAVASKGVIMGGPDVMPDNTGLQNITYPFYDQFQGKMPLFGQVEPVCYSHLHADTSYPTKYWTMPELFQFARDDLHVNYMIWVRVPTPSPSDAYDWLDAVPVIESNPMINP